ncbi:protein DpdF [Methylobacterium fujisawaense]
MRAVRTGSAQGPLPPRPRETWTPAYAKWRFLACLAAQQPGATPDLDEGVLLRQVVRWSDVPPDVGVPASSLAPAMAAAGVRSTPSGRLVADPYAPGWLARERVDPRRGLDGPPLVRRPAEAIPGEPWLRSASNHRDWQSLAQKEAAWTALTAPPGSTTLVGLPTGAGKSLVFQLLALRSTGLTVVVVPTVALAIDQCRAVREALGPAAASLDPRYFAAGDADQDPDALVAAARSRACRLVFTSPEACVTGRLRGALEEGARTGWFMNLVVDEAHVVDTWGGHFRVEFQLLGALRRRWLAASEGRLRTCLLSATYTRECRDALRSLFGEADPASWREFVAQRLRPEMDYYARAFGSEPDRDRAVLEALARLPRPAILYVTERAEATRFLAALRDAGYRRVESFHGDTPPRRRKELVDAWRDDRIDLMVATSAFGMGVDKADVRAVVHACQPENLHRYYQEVGRGGRDGATATCLLMPTPRDRRVARELAPTLLGDEKLRLRWAAMWRDARAVPGTDGDIHDLPTGARHDELMGKRSFGENIRWNKRLLLLLLRSGALEVLDLVHEAPAGGTGERRTEWVRAKLAFPGWSTDVAALVHGQRDAELALAARGLGLVDAHLDAADSVAACRVLRRQYGLGVQVACGGCRICRAEGTLPPAPCLDVPADPPARAPRLSLVLGLPTPGTPAGDEALAGCLQDLARAAVRRFACPAPTQDSLARLLARAFPGDGRVIYRIDAPHPGEGSRFAVAPDEHLVCIHPGMPDPDLLAIRRGRAVSHILCGGASAYDANGRLPLTAEGARPFPGVDAWLQSL